MFGPYSLDVGCTETSVHLSESPDFKRQGKTLFMGESGNNFYTFIPPVLTPLRPYCVPETSIAVNSNSITFEPNPKVYCSAQPCTLFALYNTFEPETISFKILTTFTGGFKFLSSEVKSNVVFAVIESNVNTTLI
jgi:hypothetical protein